MHVVRQQGGAVGGAAARESEGIGARRGFVGCGRLAGRAPPRRRGRDRLGFPLAQVDDFRPGQRQRRERAAIERRIKRGAAWREEIEHGPAIAALDGGERELVLVLHVLQVEDHGVADEKGVLGQPGLRPDAQHIILKGPGPQRGETGVDTGRIGVDQRALSRWQQRQRLPGQRPEAMHPHFAVQWHRRLAEKFGQLTRGAAPQQIHLEEPVLSVQVT